MAGLSAADKARLKIIAKLRARGLRGSDWEDLLQEVRLRAFNGSRRWPRGLPFMAYLLQGLRSVASEESRAGTYESATVTTEFPDAASGEADSVQASSEDPQAVDPARAVAARSALIEVERLFADDGQASTILHGLALGKTPEEICTAGSMTAVEYASAQKRIRRKLATHFDEEV